MLWYIGTPMSLFATHNIVFTVIHNVIINCFLTTHIKKTKVEKIYNCFMRRELSKTDKKECYNLYFTVIYFFYYERLSHANTKNMKKSKFFFFREMLNKSTDKRLNYSTFFLWTKKSIQYHCLLSLFQLIITTTIDYFLYIKEWRMWWNGLHLWVNHELK